ncbi:MAG: SIS domain-containing protein [Bacteroidota bacterium]|nr:SIS domain-containing protein [Bacteroidota bacterium]
MIKDKQLDTLCLRYPVLTGLRDSMAEAAGMIIKCYTKGGKLLICGNGGSSSDADHMVAELMKGFELHRLLDDSLIKRFISISPGRGRILGGHLEHGLPAISLSSNHAIITAVSNDMDPDLIFAQQVIGYGVEGDILIGISTSGNSQNIIDACIAAQALNLRVIGITGKTGGKMKQYCDVIVNVPETITSCVQELHLPVMHTICKIVENHFYRQQNT